MKVRWISKHYVVFFITLPWSNMMGHWTYLWAFWHYNTITLQPNMISSFKNDKNDPYQGPTKKLETKTIEKGAGQRTCIHASLAIQAIAKIPGEATFLWQAPWKSQCERHMSSWRAWTHGGGGGKRCGWEEKSLELKTWTLGDRSNQPSKLSASLYAL